MALPSGCSRQCSCRPGRDSHHPRVARAAGQCPLLLARQESTEARLVAIMAAPEPGLRYRGRTLASSQEVPANVVHAFPLLIAECRIGFAFLPNATRKLRRTLF